MKRLLTVAAILIAAAGLTAAVVSKAGLATTAAKAASPFAQNDQGSGVRAWAQVDPGGGSPVLVKTQNFVSVSSPAAGIYCLHARAGVDLANSAPVATEEQSLSTTLGLVTVRRSGIPNVNCASNELQVTTWDASTPSSPTPISTVGFDVVVP